MGHIIWLAIIGAAAGFLATRFMRLNTGVIETVAIGIGGALLGGLVLRFLATAMGLIGGLVGAGAAVLPVFP